MLRTRRWSTSLLLAAALLASSCGGPDADPQEELVAAVEATFGSSFAFAFTVDADQSALQALGEGAAQAAFFLSGFRIAGATEGDNTRLAIQLIGTDVLEVVGLGSDAIYLRLGLDDIAALTGTPLDTAGVGDQLDALGLSTEVRDVVLTALQGGWVGVQGALDAAGIQELLGSAAEGPSDEEVRDAVSTELGPDLPAFIDRFVTVSEVQGENGAQTFRVDLQVRGLLRAAAAISDRFDQGQVPLEDLEADLADLPETIPGTIVVADGHVSEIRFDLGEAARLSGSEVDGRIDLTLELDDHGEVAAIEAPAVDGLLTAEQFGAAVSQLLGFLAGVGG